MLGTTTRVRGTILVLSLATVSLAACAQSTEAAGGGDGVAAGATKEDYRAALADIEPIELSAQTPYAPGSSGAGSIEAYADALDEWSGGKVKLTVAYGNSVEPNPAEQDNALADGRLDMSLVQAMYEPSVYPALSALISMSHMGDHDPVTGMAQSFAALTETAAQTPDIEEEATEQGVKVLLPVIPSNSTGLACSARAGDGGLDGRQVRAASSVHAAEAKGLGMSPVSLDFQEVFEALERGTVDCVLSNFEGAAVGGWIPTAPHWVLDSQAGFGKSTSSLAVGLDRWERLPLAVRQLLFDRLDVFVETSADKVRAIALEGLAAIEKADGSVGEFGDEDRARLQRANDASARQVADDSGIADPKAFVERAASNHDKWRSILVDDLGFPADASYATLSDGKAGEGRDMAAYYARLLDEALAVGRPGGGRE